MQGMAAKDLNSRCDLAPIYRRADSGVHPSEGLMPGATLSSQVRKIWAGRRSRAAVASQ